MSAAALATLIVGPAYGPYLAIVVAAMGGALWPVSMAEGSTLRDSVKLFARCALTGALLTSVAVSVVAEYVSAPEHDLHVPVAFVIAALGNGVRPIIDALTQALANAAGKIGGGK